MDTQQIVGRYIEQEIAYDGESRIGPHDPLLDGTLDSLEILKLAVFLEEDFHVRVTDDELVPENFACIAKIAEFVDAKRRAQAA